MPDGTEIDNLNNILPEKIGTRKIFKNKTEKDNLIGNKYIAIKTGIFERPNRIAGSGIGIKFSTIDRIILKHTNMPTNTDLLIIIYHHYNLF